MLIGSAIMLNSPLFDSPQEAHRETPDSGQTTHDDLSHFRQRLAKDGVDQRVLHHYASLRKVYTSNNIKVIS